MAQNRDNSVPSLGRVDDKTSLVNLQNCTLGLM